MKYEFMHDNVANQVFRKASEAQRRRARIKKFVEDKYAFFLEQQALPTAKKEDVLLTSEELNLVEPLAEEIHFTVEELAYIANSRNAYRAEIEIELERVKQERALQRRVAQRTRIAAIVGAVATVVSLGFARWALLKSWEATASNLCTQSIQAFQQELDISKAYLLAKEALTYDDSQIAAWNAFYQTVFQPDASTDANNQERLLFYKNLTTGKHEITGGEPIVSIAADEALFAFAYSEKYIMLRSVDSSYRDSLKTAFKKINLLQLSPDHQTLALVGDNEVIAVYQTKPFVLLAQKKLRGRDITVLQFSEKQRGRIDLAGNGFVAHLDWQQPDATPVFALQQPRQHPTLFDKVELDKQGRFALFTSRDSAVIYDCDRKRGNNLVVLYNSSNYLTIKLLRDRPTLQVALLTPYQVEIDEVLSNKPRTIVKYGWRTNAKMVMSPQLYDDYMVISDGAADRYVDFAHPAPPVTLAETNDCFYAFGQNSPYFVAWKDKVIELYHKGDSLSFGTMYGHQEPVMWAKVLEKNNQVLSLDKNGVLKKWTIGLPCVMELNKDAALDDPNETAAFDRSEKYILTNGKCTRPRLWTVSGLLLKEFAEGTAACFSPNQQAVVTAENNNLFLWQFADMKPVARSFAQPIRWFAAAADAQHILVTTTNGDLHIFNPVTQTVNTLKHTFSPIDSAMLSPDGKYLIDFERNKTILRDAQTLRVIYELSQSPVLIAKFSFDKNDKNNMCVLTVSQVDNQGKVEMMVYRIATQEKMLQCSTINLFNDFAEYNFAAGSEYLLYPNEGKMYKHDLLRTKSCEQDHGYKAITYTPQNKRWIWLQQGGYLAAGLDGYPDLRSRAATYKLYNDETRASKIEVSADGQYWIMVANSSSKINIRTICNKRLQMVTTLDLYCRNSGEQPLENHCRPKRAHTVVFSPSGKYILTLAPNGAVKLWHFDRATVEKMMADVVG